MAIINRTPDSFYDAGRTYDLDAAVQACADAVAAGADWIDIGGQPFAPGTPLTPREEAERVLPVIEAVRHQSEIILSADTFNPEVAALSIKAGANAINDTSGLSNPDMAAVIAGSDAHLIITHSLAPPRTPWPAPRYRDISLEVADFLKRKIDQAIALGVAEEQILLDPGHDLNKNTLHSLELTRRLEHITSLGFPVLASVSNKDFIGETLGKDRNERVEGSLAAAVICVMKGARIFRMHNVAPAVAALHLTEAVLGWRKPLELRHNMTSPEPGSTEDLP
ncbi:dihydropteroate synthase [Arthrobacter sp. FW306-07-I]|uniref:dihydropteroate synthase n=1 Tax=Arthrobacter sp. FW306-07-I TaxID=2879622 RepID=UPI001F026CDE|nr:dihydropteroate synthase [Arthrobacter sp. FW306-07-I]UKA77112.1 dihydropteroate synthase [Arthrobacter sp. FW306-07-I]